MEILGLILLVVFSTITLLATLEVITLLFPAPIKRIRNTQNASLGRSFLLGLVNLVFFATIVLLLIWLTEQQIGPVLSGLAVVVALLILIGLLTLLLTGLSALAGLIGKRMDDSSSIIPAQRRGGLLLVLVGLAPFIGWFFFTPLIFSLCIGASLQTLLQRKATQPKSSSENG